MIIAKFHCLECDLIFNNYEYPEYCPECKAVEIQELYNILCSECELYYIGKSTELCPKCYPRD